VSAAVAEPLAGLAAELGPLRLPTAYCPYDPTAKQEWFLRLNGFEAFFGGAAGPGKSWGLLMAALQYVDVPAYHALILRPTLGEFEQPGGLIEVSHDWLGQTDAWWHGGRREWAFPSGATVRFGYLRNPADLKQFKGPSYSFCGFDELTSFTETLYRGMFRILRQPKDGTLAAVPLRMRAASNPGDVGHAWVKSRFVDPRSRAADVGYVPAKIADNPFLDYDAYVASLSHMSPVDRERLIKGDWDVMEEGGKFHRDRFVVIDASQVPPAERVVRYWDLAATEPSQSNPDPDYTCGLRLERSAGGVFTIADIRHGRWADQEVEDVVRQAAVEDGPGVDVYVEQEPGASGKLVVSHYKRKVLAGYACYAGLPRGGDKEVRSRPVAAAVANGLVQVVRGPHLAAFLDECQIFPNGAHDDMVDALSGAHSKLNDREQIRMRSYVPRGRIDGGGSGRRSSSDGLFGL
jgi:predicted phage terminase large subunit-like protein